MYTKLIIIAAGIVLYVIAAIIARDDCGIEYAMYEKKSDKLLYIVSMVCFGIAVVLYLTDLVAHGFTYFPALIPIRAYPKILAVLMAVVCAGIQIHKLNNGDDIRYWLVIPIAVIAPIIFIYSLYMQSDRIDVVIIDFYRFWDSVGFLILALCVSLFVTVAFPRLYTSDEFMDSGSSSSKRKVVYSWHTDYRHTSSDCHSDSGSSHTDHW